MGPTDVVKLRNGSEECAGLVAITTLALRRLMEAEGPEQLPSLLMLHDLHAFATMGVQPFTGARLAALKLVDSDGHGGWRLHDSIRNIVASAVECDGDNIRLRSALAG